MEGNPYIELIKAFRNNEEPTAYRMGTVTNTTPLKIEVSGTVQESADLLRNSSIIDLVTGDRVLLLPIEDQQKFIILCKVVSI